PKYGENVMKGILYLIELSKKGGNGVITSDPQPQGSTIYEHGIATYALGEMYALARMGRKELPGMREAFEAGVNFILNNQLANGGWRYYTGSYDKGGAADLSVTGWQYQALKAAKLTALPIPRLHEGTMKAIEYLKSTQNRTKGAGFITGGFGNTGLGAGYNQWSLSGVSILGLQTLGTGGSSTTAINNGIKFASDFYKKTPPDWGTNCNLYAWYYYSQAFYQQGGSDWKQWNDTAMAQVQNNQNSDGTWKAEGACPANSVGTSHAGGDATIYRTCLCTLMLEVYYRYLKVSDH
ncbi:MAG: hypothetical protein WCN98_01375, partial [Verrucomicrobiaceae bacterium]